MTENKVPPMDGLLLARKENLDNYTERNAHDGDAVLTSDVEYANVITSLSSREVGMHKVVIDLDMPAQLLPSSTPGHFHLLIDKEMPWEHYRQLLDVLQSVELIEPGYKEASLSRGYTAVRLPWVKKPAQSPPELTSHWRGL